MDAAIEIKKRGLKTGAPLVIEFCLIALPFLSLFFFLFSEGAHLMNQMARQMLFHLLPGSDCQILTTSLFRRPISYLSCSGGEATAKIKLLFAALSGIGLFATQKIRWQIPYKFILYFLSATTLATSLILLLFPGAFPYTIGSFAEINMKLEVFFWFMFPLMMGALLLQVNAPLLSKIVFMCGLIISTLILSLFKYTFCLYILFKCSFIVTPILFFIFGPYMNLVYLVSFFALYTSRFKR